MRAARAYSYARRYGPTALRAARKIQRFVRKRKKTLSSGRHKRARLFGDNVGSDTASKSILGTQSRSLEDSRTLYSLNATDIDHGIDKDERYRSLINLRGFYLEYKVDNNQTYDCFVNVAMVSPKDHTATAVTTTDFFRGYGQLRSVDFSGTSLSGMDFHWRPINTDLYHIFFHKRLTITGTDNIGNRTNWKAFKKYVPVKRQIRYDGVSSNYSTSPVFLIYWIDQVHAQSGDATTANIARVQFHLRAIFRHPGD